MKVWARINHVGWVHLWRRREDYEAAEPSLHFFNSRTDARWPTVRLDAVQRARLEAGELVELEDPGYLDVEGEAP